MVGSHRRRRSSLSLVQQEPDVRFYLHRLAQSPGPVLVLGAANGRVAWELARQAPRVVAIEPSERMVAAAEAGRPNQPAESSAKLRFICADLRALRLNQRFGLVVAPQNALGLISSLGDLESLVATVAEHLTPDGVFAFDVLNPPVRQTRDTEEKPHWMEPTRPVFAPHLREQRRARSGSRVSSLRRWRLRLFLPAELDQALGSGGLAAHERFGSFDGKEFEPTDPAQVVIARRA